MAREVAIGKRAKISKAAIYVAGGAWRRYFLGGGNIAC